MDKHDTYLITGATGQLGPMVLKPLIEKGVAPEVIHLLVRNPEKAKTVLESHNLPSLPLVFGDVTETAESLQQRIPTNINHVIHMAGSVKFGEKFRDEVEKINRFGAMNMAQIALERGRLTHISTAYILGGVDAELTEDFIMRDTERRPKNPYEEAKGNAENEITELFENQIDRLQILRPSILTDSLARPDLGGELHAAMGYYAPFIMLRNELNKRGETGWIDLDGFSFIGKSETEINVVDNTVAGQEIANLIITHQGRARNIVNSTPPTYRELTTYVLRELRFTNYEIEGKIIDTRDSHKVVTKKLGAIERGDTLRRITQTAYTRNSAPNYKPYATHTSHFAGGFPINNEELSINAVRALMS